MKDLLNSPNLDNAARPLAGSVAVESQPSPLRSIFIGPNGLRAGWRLAIYIAIATVIRTIIHYLRGAPPQRHVSLDAPIPLITASWLRFVAFGCAAWIMSGIEKQSWGNYGMPLRKAFRSRFWIGALIGFGGLSCVMGCLHLVHCYYIDGLALQGNEVWRFAGLWLLGFLGVAFFEEFFSRGYVQYTLASGIGFWWAALATSAVFTLGHYFNPGETFLGLTDVFLAGMLGCFIWWRTGDLWLAVGIHAMWDWGLSYFYSVPDSGVPAMGHLFNARLQGPTWLSGGSAGPEGSAINIVFDLVYFVIIAMAFPRRQYVDMNERRQTKVERSRSNVIIDATALSR